MSVKRLGLDPEGKLGLSEDDVVSVYGKWFGLEAQMTKLNEMMSFLTSWASKEWRDTNPWFTEKGCECQILRTVGGGWQKGRFRIRLEFIPDNPKAFTTSVESPPSPLEDLRSDLNINK